MLSPPVSSFIKNLGNFAGLSCLLLHLFSGSRAPFMVHAVLMNLTVWFLVVSKLTIPSKAGMLGLLMLILQLIFTPDTLFDLALQPAHACCSTAWDYPFFRRALSSR
jgi:membrane-bound ClpP family serine protease